MPSPAVPSSVYLLFDADCGFCQRWVNWAKQRGADAAVTFQPCQSAVEIRQIAGLTPDDCGRSAFLVESENGRLRAVRSAAGAINGVLARMPGGSNALWRAVSQLYRVPGIKQLEDIGYRFVARNRHRLGAGNCQIKH